MSAASKSQSQSKSHSQSKSKSQSQSQSTPAAPPKPASASWRLRGTLRIAITCLPLLGGACTKEARRGGGTQSPTPSPSVALSDAGAPTALVMVADAAPSPQVQAEIDAKCADRDIKVGRAGELKPFARDDASARGCPVNLTTAALPALGAADHPFSIQIRFQDGCTAAQQLRSPDACAYEVEVRMPTRGRPAVEHGAEIVAPVQASTRWRRGAAPRIDHLGDDARAALAAEWLATARAEHASVASFARATLELMAVGAPPELLAACSRAAIDEVRHAELTFALASAYAGRALDPGPLPALTPRGGGLAALARDTFLEGCVGETGAVLEAEHALAALGPDGDPAVRDVLERIVRDETRHAELAWQTVTWAVASGGPDVLAAVHAAARAAEPTTRPETWREVIAPSLALLG